MHTTIFFDSQVETALKLNMCETCVILHEFALFT